MATDIKSFNKARGFTSSQKSAESNISKYAYFLGGTDVTNGALQQYDLARTGYGRIFIVQMPKYMNQILPDSTKKVKHLLEFANVGIDGIQGYSVDFSSLTAGYSGNTIEIPTNAKDDTSSISLKIYETSTHLIRSYIDTWITGVIDPYTGLTHYHGAMKAKDTSTKYVSQSFHTMEAIYVATDPTGTQVKYACLLANMFPKASDHAPLGSVDPGSHDLMQISIDFTANKYMSPQITSIGQNLVNNQAILKNYLNFKSSKYNASDSDKYWSKKDGKSYTYGKGKPWTEAQTTQYYSGDKSSLEIS